MTRVSLLADGQNPISLEYQIRPLTIDTLVTGMPQGGGIRGHGIHDEEEDGGSREAGGEPPQGGGAGG